MIDRNKLTEALNSIAALMQAAKDQATKDVLLKMWFAAEKVAKGEIK